MTEDTSDATEATETDDTTPDGWERRPDSLHRELEFDDFAAAFAFMTAVAAEAERLDHHPDWSNAWNKVVIDLSSHDEGKITSRDMALAKAIDAILARG